MISSTISASHSSEPPGNADEADYSHMEKGRDGNIKDNNAAASSSSMKQAQGQVQEQDNRTSGKQNGQGRRRRRRRRNQRMLRQLEWSGQTIASLCWIISVFFYGISSTGDWLQLCAASAWFLSNVFSLILSHISD